jgi:hypothetical protein
LQEVGDHGLEEFVDLRVAPTVISNDESDRVVPGPWAAEVVGEGADLAPRLGHRIGRVVEPANGLAESGI